MKQLLLILSVMMAGFAAEAKSLYCSYYLVFEVKDSSADEAGKNARDFCYSVRDRLVSKYAPASPMCDSPDYIGHFGHDDDIKASKISFVAKAESREDACRDARDRCMAAKSEVVPNGLYQMYCARRYFYLKSLQD